MSKDGFFFEDTVGILPTESMRHEFRDAEVRIRMAQNGFELHYQNKDFVAKTLKEALGIAGSWFEDMAKEAGKSKEKEND